MRPVAREKRRSITILHRIERLLRDEPDETVELVDVLLVQLLRARGMQASRERRTEEPAA
jgi:hypothetical protein